LLRRQIESLDAASMTLPAGQRLTVLADPSDSRAAEWVVTLQSGGVHAQLSPLQHAFDWTATEALNTALVPAQALARLGEALTTG
jgi:hypothetical protein